MKTRNFLLALGCAAAFTACTNNDEPAVAPAMRTVTLSVEVAEPADTRVDYTEDGNTYKFKWSNSDKLRVFYEEQDGLYRKYEDFSIKTINGKQAEFQGVLPTGYNNVTIAYCNFTGEGGYQFQPEGEPITTDNPLEKQLTTSTVLYATNVSVNNNQLANVKLNHVYAYLLLKKDLLITSTSVTGTISYSIMTPSKLIFSSKEVTLDEESKAIDMFVDVTNGKLSNDYFVPIYVGKDGSSKLTLWTWVNSLPIMGGINQPAQAYMPGVIYEVKADNENWNPILK